MTLEAWGRQLAARPLRLSSAPVPRRAGSGYCWAELCGSRHIIEPITCAWCEDTREAENLAAFFSANVTPSYITQDELDRGRAIGDDQWSPHLPSVMQQEFAAHIKAHNVAVVREGNRVIACGILVAHHKTTYLNDLIVARSHQRRGIGRRFLEWLKPELRRRSVAGLSIACGKSNLGAQAFFLAAGFRPCAEQPDPLSVQMSVRL